MPTANATRLRTNRSVGSCARPGVLVSWARARAHASDSPGRAQLPTERFIRNLVAMAAAMSTAPSVDA